jgi:hypothetical protein
MRYDEIIDVRLLAPLATALAIIVTVTLWVLNQRRKELSWKLLAQTESSAVVQIINTGHIAVVPGDYHSPLAVSAGPGARVISAVVLSTVPGDLEDRCRNSAGERRELLDRISGNEVLLAPVLLNDGDAITVKMEVENLRGGVRVNGHINGVRKISPWRPNTLIFQSLAVFGGLVMVASFGLLQPPAVLKYGIGEALPAILFFLFGYTVLSAGLYGKEKAAGANLEPAV